MPRKAPILTLTTKGAAPLEQALERSPFVIGREAGCDLVLDMPWVSRRQLVFEQRGGAWHVTPEGRNKMQLNDAPLTSTRPLSPGDRIVMGPATLLFDAGASARKVDLDDAEIGPPTMELSLQDVIGGTRARGRGEHLAVLGKTSVALAAADDEEEAAHEASLALLEALRARSACVVIGDSRAAEVLGASGGPIERVSRRLIERALSAKATITIDDPAASDLAGNQSFVFDRSTGPILVSALGPPSTGAILAVRAAGAPPFSEDDAAFATVLAHLAGAALDAAAKTARLAAERARLVEDIERRGRFGGLIGDGAAMQKVAGAITKVAPTDATVLITGETGSGKELVAREIHRRSARKDAPFFALNCAALPETLIESELFGHRRGAFSGADRDRKGIFELAAGGTVFLDEIGELPLAAQAKVLRVLDAREILPLGGGMPIKIDVRLLGATHRDLEKEVQNNRFRQDLLYRLRVFPLLLPPLRDRKEDLSALIEHFLETNPEARKKGLRSPTPAALAALESHSFPGNVRELAHIVVHAAILAEHGEALDVHHLPEELVRLPPPAGAVDGVSTARPKSAASGARPAPSSRAQITMEAAGRPLREAVGAFERELMIRELEVDRWNRTACAKRLKVSLRAFMDKVKRYDIKEPD